MIQLSPQTKIFLYNEAIDFRSGIDGLSSICKNKIMKDPFSGVLFVFIGKSKCSIKMLIYDGQGFWLIQKRLSKGKFSFIKNLNFAREVHLRDLQIILWNGDPHRVNFQEDWKKLE